MKENLAISRHQAVDEMGQKVFYLTALTFVKITLRQLCFS